MENGYLRSGVDVADIGGNARCTGDIVKGEGRNEGVELHQKREGLSDPAGGAEDGYLALRHWIGGVATARQLRAAGHGGSEHRWFHHFWFSMKLREKE